VGDSVTQAAKTDLTTAYNAAAGRTPVTVATELGGTSPVPGIYNSADGMFVITGTLTLTGNATDVWIFQTATTLITAVNSKIIMGGTAKAGNVYWVVGNSATLGTNTTFVGNILALTSITLNTGAKVEGRTLARNGAVTLDTNSITKPAP
jgi:type VI secretion system secreted protein VgrG